MNLRQLLERSDRPFLTHPQVGRYFPAASIEEARQRVARSIERGDGPTVVIGAAGTGKSLLLQVLAAQYRQKFDVVLLACAQLCTRRALLQAIHFELGLEYRQRDEGQLRLSLLEQLLSGEQSVQGLLLLVDEAQTVPNHLLDELRMITNLAPNGVPRVRLVVAGLQSLEEKLASPELESFSQRLAARCYITPFTREETAKYVRAQLAASSIDAERLFAPGATDALFSATDGVPRLVNQLCDRALLMADARKAAQIDANLIQVAWADLQQLPTPWEASPATATTSAEPSSVVEFGSLDELTAPAAAVAWKWDADQVATPLPSATAAAPKFVPAPRKREMAGYAPPAVDPFADQFAEEEWVLDNFASLTGMFHARTPRVQNRRDPAFSRMVQQVLDAPTLNSVKDVEETELDFEEPVVADRPALRLAVVVDSPPQEPKRPTRPSGKRTAVEFAELFSQFVDEEELAAPRRRNPVASSAPPSRAAQVAPPEPAVAVAPPDVTERDSHPRRDVAEDILVIEDDSTGPVVSQPGVRREEYRQLFSRLRHGA